jgi:hypothetical protein
MEIRYAILLGIVAMMVAACANQTASKTPPEHQIVETRDKLPADMRQCTEQQGYDPAKITGVAESALAPQELQWRQCVYDALRVYARANPAIASKYEQLIAEDTTMTTAIQRGTMTRGQRRTRVEQLIAAISSAEEAQISAAATEHARQMRQLQNQVNGLRALR